MILILHPRLLQNQVQTPSHGSRGLSQSVPNSHLSKFFNHLHVPLGLWYTSTLGGPGSGVLLGISACLAPQQVWWGLQVWGMNASSITSQPGCSLPRCVFWWNSKSLGCVSQHRAFVSHWRHLIKVYWLDKWLNGQAKKGLMSLWSTCLVWMENQIMFPSYASPHPTFFIGLFSL